MKDTPDVVEGALPIGAFGACVDNPNMGPDQHKQCWRVPTCSDSFRPSDGLADSGQDRRGGAVTSFSAPLMLR
ncbi:hypothetical protein GCM10011581_04540 [Saccharopolyspora subtropica]|uniref:Uncharacterized protein n=1 Tax=Saccharopolyspora thermophila TaxID=89367 RepID=A0A917JJA7_9PSEU|nr:hypothetical protein GCM10011581_04540 [Saccharopolyspora subtropica]